MEQRTANRRRSELVQVSEPPSGWRIKKGKRHASHGCSPVKPHNTFSVGRLASPLCREDLRFIGRRPESVMGILQKVNGTGHVP